MLKSSVYDKLKPVTQVWLPALGAAYFGLAQIWDYPYGEEVVGSLAVITTFFGVVLQVSTDQYNRHVAAHSVDAGEIVVTDTEEGKKVFTLDLSVDPEVIANREIATFSVTHPANEEFWEPRHLAD